MAETMDVTEFLKGSVPTITAALGMLLDAELVTLHDAEEKAAKPRRTLLDAIHGEQKARAEQAALEAQFANAKAVLAGDDAVAKVAVLVELADMAGVKLPTPDQLTTLQDRIGALEDRLGVAVAAADAAPVRSEAVKIELADVARDGEPVTGYMVAFTGDDDVTLTALPMLQFGPEAFAFNANDRSALLLPQVVLPDTGPRCNVAKLWLLNQDGAGLGVCTLLAALPAGGGTEGMFRAKSVIFHAA